MPKSKAKRTRRDENDDDEDDYEPCTQSQGATQSHTQQSQGATQSHTQAEKAMTTITPDEQNRRVTDIVRYLLMASSKNVPIKKQDISRHVLSSSGQGKAFPILFELATKQMEKVFGIQVVEIENSKKYILVNKFDQTGPGGSNPHLKWSADENAKNGFLTIILSMIFMNNNILADVDMWRALKKIGVDSDGPPHPVLGDVKHLVYKEFVREGYLLSEKREAEPPVYELEWGPKAKHEVTKRDILTFVGQMYSDEHQEFDIKQWKSQYRDSEGQGETEVLYDQDN